MKRIVLIALALCACGRNIYRMQSDKPPCESYCGMLLEDVGNGAISCEKLQEAEDAVLSEMDTHCEDDERLCKQAACEELFGYQIHAKQEVVECGDALYSDGTMKRVCWIGETTCQSHEINVFAAMDWRHGSLPHELVHAMQNCHPPASWVASDSDNNGDGHQGWTSHGIYWSIEKIKRGF